LNKIIFFIFISELLLLTIGIIKTPTWGDELNFHAPLAQNISWEKIIDADSNYSSAYTPLPYIIGNLFYRIKASLYTLRIVNGLVYILTIIVVFKLFSQIDKTNALALTALTSLNPYLFRAGYIYLMSNYGILFALTGIYVYFYLQGAKRLWLSHICWMAAVLSMQWILLVYVAFVIYEFELFVLERKDYKAFAKLFLLKIISLLPALYLFWCWQGLTHPNFHSHTLASSIAHVDAVLSVLGFWFFLFIITEIKKLKRKIVAWLIFLVPVLLLNLPKHAAKHGLFVITGIASAFCKKTEQILQIPYSVSTAVLVLAGVLLLVMLWNNDGLDDFQRTMLYMVSGLFTAFAVSTLLGASHIFIAMPFILFIPAKKPVQNRKLFSGLVFQYFVMSIAYNGYIIFFRSHAMFFN